MQNIIKQFLKSRLFQFILLLTLAIGIILKVVQFTDDSYNLLIVGYKGAGTDEPYYTDSMIVMHFDKNQNSVKSFSIPRDLFIRIHGSKFGKINSIVPHARKELGLSTDDGLALLKDRISAISAVPIDGYLAFDLTGFNVLIDSVGGLDVNVKKSIDDPMFPKNTIEIMHYKLSTGIHHMNATDTMRYVRSRHGSSDYDRSLRQQQIVSLLTHKLFTISGLFGVAKNLSFVHHMQYSISPLQGIRLSKFYGGASKQSISLRGDCKSALLMSGCVLYSPTSSFYTGPSIVLVSGSNLGNLEKYDYLQEYLSDYLK